MRLLLAVFLGLALAQFKNDRLLAHFENSAVKLKNADKKKGPNLVCGSDKIEISFEMAELDAMKLGVDDPTKIFFRGNKNCFSVLDGTKYTLTLFFPFTSCGTNVVHDTEDFVYTNQIMLQLEKNRDLTLLHFRCVYEDKYIVSYNEGITPVKRTLQFDTRMGKFDVDMKLYKTPQFQESERLENRAGVFLNETVYVSTEMYDPLKRPEIVLSIQTCFATDSPDFSDMNKLHNLIASMCTHPDDETVQILENGVSDRARFSFKMFRFTESFSYIYLHCEVKVCNSTAETCVGSQGLCNGGEWERKRRSAEEAGSAPGDTQQFISRGPLIAYMQENAGEGDYTVTSLFLEEDGDSYILGNPKLYIFGTVASGVIFGVVVGLTMIIFKHKKTAKVQREEFKNFEQIQSISKILAGCRPGGATFGRWTLKRPDYQKT